MSNLRLFTTSIIIISVLTGTAHLLANIKPKSPMKNNTVQQLVTEQIVQEKKPLETFVGNWEVLYKSEEFTGKIHYNLKFENNQIKGYMTKVFDKDGYFEDVNELTLTIKSYNEKKNKAKGLYTLKHEGKNYDTACIMVFKTKDKFELSYSFYGYNGAETWIKLTK